MKFRKILFGAATLLAVTAAFGFTNAKKVKMFSAPADAYYAPDNGCSLNHMTDQADCLWYNTGAQCTVTLGVLGALPAFEEHTNPTCTVALRQP